MEKTTKEMKLIPIDELIPYVNNARTHSPEQINKLWSSLREFGFINPVIIDRDKNIIAGHGRVMAAREEGIKEVPCVLVDYLTEAQKKAFSCFHDAMAQDASIYVFYATMKARVFYDAFEDAGFKVGAGLIWKKPKAPFMRTDWKFNMEPIIFGWRKDGKHNWYGNQK